MRDLPAFVLLIKTASMHQLVWLRISVVLAVFAVLLLVWTLIPATVDLHEISTWLAPHRQAWYALPMVMLAFIVLALVPVVLLIAATGIAFGPVLGPLYAMAGCLASASSASRSGAGWAADASSSSAVSGSRRITRRQTQRHARRLPRAQSAGALHARQHRRRRVDGRYRDFIIGTVLGMGASSSPWPVSDTS